MELHIVYLDYDGEITSRRISDIRPLDDVQADGFKKERRDRIKAYCHLRSENLEFNLFNILQAVITETGEVIENLWAFLGMVEDKNGRPKINALVASLLSAIKSLKYFCLQVRIKRGFAQKEREKILNYILKNSDVPFERYKELDEWLVKIWCGDMYKKPDPIYLEFLKFIPESQLNGCRETAFNIASGSGRRQIEQDVIDRINKEFPGQRG